jgi:hypothetical protein
MLTLLYKPIVETYSSYIILRLESVQSLTLTWVKTLVQSSKYLHSKDVHLTGSPPNIRCRMLDADFFFVMNMVLAAGDPGFFSR